MDEKQLQILYNQYGKSNGFKDYNEFKSLISNDNSRKIFFDNTNSDLGFKDFNEFNTILGFDSQEVKSQFGLAGQTEFKQATTLQPKPEQKPISTDNRIVNFGNDKPVNDNTRIQAPQDAVQREKMFQNVIKTLPALRENVVKNKTLDILQKQGKLPAVGSYDYLALKPQVEANTSEDEYLPEMLRHHETKQELDKKAVTDFSLAQNESPEEIQKNIDAGKYVIQDGKVKEIGGFGANFSQGVRDFVNNIGLAMNVSAAQSEGNNNKVKYVLNQFTNNKKNERETASNEIGGYSGKLLGGLVPYAGAGVLLPGSDIPLMGFSNMGAMNQEIWNDPNKTDEEKINSIKRTNSDAMLTGTLQGIGFHAIGGVGEKQTANSLLKQYAPTSALKKTFTQNLYNDFGDLLKTSPEDVSKAAAIGGGTELLNDLTKKKEGLKVDFSNIAEGALNMAALDLVMKIPKVLTVATGTLKAAKNSGYDKINPDWYNQYNRQTQDALNAIVAAPEKIYNDAVSQLDKSPDPNAAAAKLKIETFRGYYNSLPAELPTEAKSKALHILQLKTEAIDDANNAPEGGIKNYYQQRASAYDGLLNKVLTDGKIDEKKEPLLLPRFAASVPKNEEEIAPENLPDNAKEEKQAEIIQQPQDEGTASGNEPLTTETGIPATTEVNKNSEPTSQEQVDTPSSTLVGGEGSGGVGGDVESTAKALDELNKNNSDETHVIVKTIKQKIADLRESDGSISDDNLPEFRSLMQTLNDLGEGVIKKPKSRIDKNAGYISATSNDISKLYHQAKEDGTHPELVKEVEQSLKETPTPKGNTSNVVEGSVNAEQVRNKLQEIEKQPVKINVTQDANGKMEQNSQEVIDNIKAELDKTGLPYSDVISNDKGSTYFVVTKDGQQHEILKVLQSGGKLLPTNLRKAKWINHLIKTEKDAVVKAVEQSIKETTKAETPTTTKESNVVETPTPKGNTSNVGVVDKKYKVSKNENGEGVILEHDNGFRALLTPKGKELEIKVTGIPNEADRGKGFGKVGYESIMDYAKENGYDVVKSAPMLSDQAYNAWSSLAKKFESIKESESAYDPTDLVKTKRIAKNKSHIFEVNVKEFEKEQSLSKQESGGKAPVTKPEGKSDVVVDKASNVGGDENAIVKFQQNNPEVRDLPLNTIEENLNIGDTVHGNISGQKVSGKVKDVGVHKGQIVVDITDQNGNDRFLYSKNIERIEPKQKEVERLTAEQNKRFLELLNKEETTADEIKELGELGKMKRGEIYNPSKELPNSKQESDVVGSEDMADTQTENPSQKTEPIVEDNIPPQPPKDLGTKARDYAKQLRSGDKKLLPDWLQANLPEGTQRSGIDITEAFAKALETFADIHDKTKDFTKAIEEGFKHLKDWFDENKIPYNEKELKEKFANDRKAELPPTGNKKGNETGGSNTVGVSHAALTDLAQRLGLKEPERGTYINPETYADRGRKLLEAGADPEEINNPNNTLHDRIAIGRAHLEDLVKVADDAMKKGGIESPEFEAAQKALNEYASKVKALGTDAHRAMVSLQGERDLDTNSFTAVRNNVEDLTGKAPSKEQDAKIKDLTEQNQALKTKAEEAETKLIQETDKAFKEGVEAGKKKSNTEKAKNFADKFRKLKSKPFVFKDENGNIIQIQKAGSPVEWNDLVELGAKAIEKTGKIIDGISEIIDKVKDAEWYKALSEKDRISLEKQLTNHYENIISETPEAKNVKRLEKQLEDLQNGIAKQSDAVKRKLSDREKELQDQIFEAKKNLGLVASKDLPKAKINKTSEQIKLDRLQKELEDLQQGIVKQKTEKTEDTQAVKDLKEKILQEKEKLGLRPSKMNKPEDEISPEQKNIERLQKELERLQTKGKLKNKTDSREITDEEKILQDQIKSEQNKIKLKKLQQDFLNKKDTKFSTDEAKSIWDYAKSEYLDNGVSFRDMIGQVANDLGLSWRQITEAVTTPKTKRISDEMWKKQGEYRRNQNATKNWIADQNKSKAIKALKFIPDKLRGLAVFGHGGIFVGTHSGMNLFMPSTWNKVLPAFIRGWKYAYGNEANYQRAIEELKNQPNYLIAQRAGLKNNPERVNVEEFQKSQSTFGKLGLAGEKGFNAIKVLRQDLFDYHYNKLSQAEKADPESAKSIARLINNATGATNLNIPEWINEVTFAGGMEAARWGKLTRNPVEATNTAIRAILKPESASVGDRVFAKVWARRVGEQLATYGTLLALNAALQSKIDPKNKTNITDPTKGAWLKFKFGDKTLDLTSGMISVATFISSLINDSIKNKKERRGDSVLQSDAKNTFGYLRGKLSPGYGTALDLKTGTDFAGNTLPYNSDKPQAGKRQLSWLEYAEQKLPLPVAEAFTIMRQSAQDNGMEKPQLENIMDGIMAGGVSFATGFRMGETKEKPTPYTEEDNKDPRLKYWLDKGLALPNVQLSSAPVYDKATDSKKMVSDYSPEIQKQYTDAHTDFIKSISGEVQDRGYVYISSTKNKDGKQMNIYLTYPESSKGTITRIALDAKNNPDKYKVLTKEQLPVVLSKIQKQATVKAKEKVFKDQPIEPEKTDDAEK